MALTLAQKQRRSTGRLAYGVPVQVLDPYPKPGDAFIHPVDQQRYFVAEDGSWRRIGEKPHGR